MPLWFSKGDRKWAKCDWSRKNLGMDVYVFCPGPSLNVVDHADVESPGIFKVVVNTAYPKIKRPDLWIGMDEPLCYDRRMWFEAFPKVCRSSYQRFITSGKCIMDYPQTYFMDTKDGKIEDIFGLTGPDAQFIFNKNSFHAMLSIIAWMGAKKIHFIGCDFGGKKAYYDERVLNSEMKIQNERLYKNLMNDMRRLKEPFEKNGVSVVSCTPDSPLNDIYPYVDLRDALEASRTYTPKYKGRLYTSAEAERVTPYDQFSSHENTLKWVCEALKPEVIVEFGLGIYSTPLLIDLAGTKVVGIHADRNAEWKSVVDVALTDDQKKKWQYNMCCDMRRADIVLDQIEKIDLIFVDDVERGKALDIAVKYCDTVVMHDWQHRSDGYKDSLCRLPDGWVEIIEDAGSNETCVWTKNKKVADAAGLTLPSRIEMVKDYSRGVVVQVANRQEWMFEWWIKNYFKHNSIPVTAFCESVDVMRRLEKHGIDARYVDVPFALPKHRSKTLIVNKTPYEKSIYMDIDVECRGEIYALLDMLDSTNGEKIVISPDAYANKKYLKEHPSDMYTMNSGLIAYRKNDPLMKKWMVNSIMLKDVPEGEHHSDQAVLNYLMYHDNYDPTEIPLSYASFGHAIHTGQETLIHWCGYGQTAIRRALASLKDYDWNMHRYYDLSWLYGHPEQDEGVLAASDDKQEWMIPWFVGNCRRHSRLPIAVANLGLTQGAVDWCEKNGVKVITLADKFSKAKDTFGWFKKPLACIATPFKKTIFMDTDVEVRKPFDAISSSVFSERQVAMRHDVYTVNSKYTDALPTTDPKIWNSGVIVYHHGNEIIRQWAIKMMQLMSSKPWEYVDGFGGDQDLLSMLIIMHAKESLVELPVSQVRLRVEGDGDSILYHWTGPTGKEHIKNSLLHRLKQAQNIGQ